MKIGFLLPSVFGIDSPGNGVRRQAVQQAEALRDLGHDVVLIDPWQLNDPKTFDVIQFFVGGFAFHGIETIGVGKALRVWAPMIDSNQSFKSYRLAARLGQLHPRIFTIPGIMRWQATIADLVVARSSHEQARVVEGLGIPATKVRIVLNGVTPPPVTIDRARAAKLTGWTEPFALHIGAYTQERKNTLNLVRAVGPTGLKLAIGGTAVAGTVLDELNRLVKQYPNVKLLGYLTEADRDALYAACRVFCLPSEHEGTGLVAVEAASCGAAVVITKNGGPPDYFGTLAYYVNPHDVGEIRQAVQKAMAAEPTTALRDHVLQHLTWRQSAESLIAAYSAAIAQRSARD